MKNLIIIIGQSCSGKTTLASKFHEAGCPIYIRHTTRPPREGEIDGIDYWFVDKETMNQIRCSDDLIGYSRYDTYMGTYEYAMLSQSYKYNEVADSSASDTCVMVLNEREATSFRLEKWLKKESITADVIILDGPLEVLKDRARYRGDNIDEFKRRYEDFQYQLTYFIRYSRFPRMRVTYDISKVPLDIIVENYRWLNRNLDQIMEEK